jgi:hypothetical protein
MRVFGPVRVEAEGFPQRKHRFMSGGQVLGELETSAFSRESVFRQADGQQFVIRPKGFLSSTYHLQQGEVEWATAERMEISYRAVPYYLRRAGSQGAWQLRNEQDAVVLEITKPGFLASGAEIEMMQDGDLPLVVLAYFLMRRRIQSRRRRVGASG